METIKQIQEHPVYQEIVKESYGGIMYNVANRHKYDDEEIMKLWDSVEPVYKEAAGGIMKGAFNFLKEV